MAEVVTETVYMDAVLAEKYLEKNAFHEVGVAGTNRKVSKRTVTKFAIVMAKGRWLLTHQGISINDRNEIEDGQHRLLAVIEADRIKPGVVVPFRVTTGIPAGGFAVLDAGLRRRPGDVASSMGVANSFQAASTAKWFHSYVYVPFEYSSAWQNPVQWDSSMIPDMLENYPNILEAVARVRSKSFNGNLTAISTGLALALEYRPDVDAEKFIWRLETGLDTSEGEPAYMLREKLGLMQRTGYNYKIAEQLAFFIKAYNKYILGDTISIFRWAPLKEGFPRLIAGSYPETDEE